MMNRPVPSARRIGRASFVLWAIALDSGSAIACEGAIKGVEGTPVAQYDPFRNAAVKERFVVELEISEEDSPCQLGLSIAGVEQGSLRTLSLGSAQLHYRLSTNGIELVNDAQAFVPLTGTLERVELTVDVPAGQIGPAGIYTDRVSLRLVDMARGRRQLGNEVPAIITSAIESRAQANLAGGSLVQHSSFSFARLDFGVLKQGAIRDGLLQVRSTAPVTVTIRSENKGELRSGPRPGKGLAYSLSFNREPVNLAVSDQRSVGFIPPSFAGISFPIAVRIEGDPDRLAAGEYRDLLTFDITSQ